MTEDRVLRVCHMTSAHGSRDVRIFLKECRSLAAAGFEVYYIVPGARSETIDGVHIVGVPGNNGGRLRRMLITTRQVRKAAQATGSSVFHFHDPELMFAGIKLKNKGFRVIYDVHEDVCKQILSKHYISKPLRKIIASIIRFFEQRISRRLDCCLTATEAIMGTMLKYGANAGTLFNYPLIAELPVEVNWTEKKDEVCYAGVITEARGIRELINIFDYPEVSGVCLNLAGEFSPGSLLAEISAMKGWGNVNYFGVIPRNEMYAMLSRSKVGMLTLHPEPNHVEALPNKMFEYMSAGLPVIASDFPGWRNLLEKEGCGICVNPLDPYAIASAVAQLTNDDKLAEQLGRNGRELVVNKYNWSIEEKKLIDIYMQFMSHD